MAAEAAKVVEFSLQNSDFKLVRKENGVEFYAEGNKVMDNLDSAELKMESLELSFMNRPAGKIDVNLTQEKCEMDVETIKGKVDAWFPPIDSKVKHVHSKEEFVELVSSGFVVCKWSTEWCGPCKAVAPKIAKLSAEFQETTFLHIDCDELKDLAQENGVKCYPTFTFWNEGAVTEGKVEGGIVAKIRERLEQNGGPTTELDLTPAPFEGEETLHFVVAGDEFKFSRENDATSISINGQVKVEDYPQEVKIDTETRSFVLGRSRFTLSDTYDADQIQGFAAAMPELWPKMPTNVVHVHSTKEFDDMKKECPKLVAKYSADWCGPCHQIAPVVDKLSIKHETIRFVHVDVDKLTELSGREGVRAMPTFHFYLNGERMDALMVQGANKEKLTKSVTKFSEF